MRLAARVFESSPDGIVIADRRHRILSANPAFLDAFHYSRTELEGRRPNQLFLGAMDRAQLRQMLKALAWPGSSEAEVVAVRKTGDIFPALVKVSADRNPDGTVSHYVMILNFY